jgi:hypothetical protein
MAKKLLEKEVEEWFENMDDDLQEAFLELDDIDDVRVHKFIRVSISCSISSSCIDPFFKDSIKLKIGEEESVVSSKSTFIMNHAIFPSF